MKMENIQKIVRLLVKDWGISNVTFKLKYIMSNVPKEPGLSGSIRDIHERAGVVKKLQAVDYDYTGELAALIDGYLKVPVIREYFIVCLSSFLGISPDDTRRMIEAYEED